MNRLELGIHQGEHYLSKSSPKSVLVTVRKPGESPGVYPVVINPDRLPFASKDTSPKSPDVSIFPSIQTINPPRGVIGLPELRRVGRVENTHGESVFSTTPILGKIFDASVEFAHSSHDSQRWSFGVIEKRIANGELRTIENIQRDLTNLDSKDARWFAIDSYVTAIQGGLIWVINTPLLPLVQLVTGDIRMTVLALGAVHFIVREPYHIFRAAVESIGILRAKENLIKKSARLVTGLVAYPVIFMTNLLPGPAYITTPLLSLPRNFEESIKLSLSEIKRFSSRILGNRHSSTVVPQNIYEQSHQPALESVAKEMREEIADSPIPIFTLSRVGNEKIDERAMDASRAHLSDAVDAASMFNFGYAGLPVCDLGEFLNGNNHEKVRNIAVMGRFLARHRRIARINDIAAPILRKLLSSRLFSLENKIQPTVDFFMDGLVNSHHPIVTFHYAAANDIVKYLLDHKIYDRPVIQWMTDPNYVHKDYLKYKKEEFVHYFVFDEKTRQILLDKDVPEDRIVVAGFPLSVNITHPKGLSVELKEDLMREKYLYEDGKMLKVTCTTGGLGGNQDEILQIADGLDFDHQRGVFYCGTNTDLGAKLVQKLTQKGINPEIIGAEGSGKLKSYFEGENARKAVIIMGTSLKELLPISNEALDWCDIGCTKTSGDIAIELHMAGKPIVVLDNWGRHEGKIEEIIRESGGVLDLDSLDNIGVTLHQQFRSNKLFFQVNELWHKLRTDPPFPYDWKDRSLKALLEIEKQYESRRRFATASVSP